MNEHNSVDRADMPAYPQSNKIRTRIKTIHLVCQIQHVQRDSLIRLII